MAFVRSETIPYEYRTVSLSTSRATVPSRTVRVHQLTCRVDDGGAAALGMRTVLYCTALHVDTGALIFGRDAFGIRLGFV